MNSYSWFLDYNFCHHKSIVNNFHEMDFNLWKNKLLFRSILFWTKAKWKSIFTLLFFFKSRSFINFTELKNDLTSFCQKNCMLMTILGVIHKPRGQNFDSPSWSLLINMTYVIKWSFDQPPSPSTVHVVYGWQSLIIS